jgi:hypothetical protein
MYTAMEFQTARGLVQDTLLAQVTSKCAKIYTDVIGLQLINIKRLVGAMGGW